MNKYTRAACAQRLGGNGLLILEVFVAKSEGIGTNPLRNLDRYHMLTIGCIHDIVLAVRIYNDIANRFSIDCYL